jgi:hypothetical protein
MRKVHPDELQHISGGLLPLFMVPIMAVAFGLGLGTGLMAREANCARDREAKLPTPLSTM